jgi:SAM-dependent methyltransferase
MLDQQWDASAYDARYSYVTAYGGDLIQLLKPQPGERILDLGCGTGHLTKRIADVGAVTVGLDGSAEMIERARKEYPDLEWIIADGADFEFAEPLDAVFSNAALHWMKRPKDVAACVSRALKSGGRFVAEFGGKGNIQTLVEALYRALETVGVSGEALNPWYYPSIGEYGTLLESVGLTPTAMWLFDRPTRLNDGENGLRNWLDMFAHPFLDAVPIYKRPDVVQNMEREARPLLYKEDAWHVDYRRLRLVAVKRHIGQINE